MPEIEINEQFAAALEALEKSSRPLFITGRAGTGKSTLLTHFRRTTEKEVAVLAPTGVAAVNVSGQTIHSFFKFRPDMTPEKAAKAKPTAEQSKLYKSLDTIIIDEVSMVRADLLDCVDRFLRSHGPSRGKAFGGIQMVFIGDLYQLPPVVTARDKELFQNTTYASPYFFDAQVMLDLPLKIIELEKIYRQSDEAFIQILQNVRTNSVSAQDLAILNERFELEARSLAPGEEFTIALTTTNDLADTINQRQLEALPVKGISSSGIVTGAFTDRELPTKVSLDLKVGAQIMLLNNDPAGRWVNGTLGKIIDIPDDYQKPDGTISVELSTGKKVKISPFTWEMFRYFFDDHKGHVDTESVGSFRQYPLRLAWAVTIHKAQGKTFDRVIIDIGRGTFSHGQMYVALSRCRTLEGITLRQPIERRNIYMDNRVIKFFERADNPEKESDGWWEQNSLFD